MASGGRKEDLETLFARRREIDRALLEQHSKELAILFTDIVGSTQYFEAKGDIAGLELVRRHNDLLFPVVEAHRGWIVKTIGDAIMAVFPSPIDAVRCAVQMQRTLAKANAEPDAEPIHIRVGAHFGRALVEEGRDVYGDAVNTAARVVNQAKGGEIVLSSMLAAQLPPAEGHVLVAHGQFQPKGKTEPLPLFLVHWGEGPARAQMQPQVQAGESPAAQPPMAQPAKELFVLDVQVGARGLKVTALDGAADKGTVKAYAEVALSLPRLDELAGRFGTFMRAGGEASYLERVKTQGQELFRLALSDRAQKRLQETKVEHLRLQLDDQLVHVPWELLHDGREFLALRFSMGRVVNARSETAPGLRRLAPVDGHALVVSNPSGDLDAAMREGEAVAGLLRDGFGGEVRHIRGPVPKATFLAALKGCALLHFAGHADRPGDTSPGGFRLQDGLVTPEGLTVAVGASAPALVFANSCHSSTGAGFRSEEGGPDLASALLMRGTRHFVGPRWDIADEDAVVFALRFYERALAGVPLGDSVRAARQALRGPDHRPLSFAGYVLYGEPRERLPGAQARAGAQVATRSSSRDDNPATPSARRRAAHGDSAGHGDAGTHRDAAEPGKATRLAALGVAALIALGAVGIAWALLGQTAPSPGAPVAEDPPAGTEARPPDATGPPRAPATPAARTGPVRLSMLEFKNITRDPEVEFLGAGLTESMITDFGEHPGVRLIERAQIELDLAELEFSQSKFVDPTARAQLGKIAGAEVVVLGGFQRVGRMLRAHARFVDVETGEVLHALRVEHTWKKGDDGALFELQNKLSNGVRAAVPELVARVRPQ